MKTIFSSNEDIIRLIKDGSHDEIGAEKLRGLLKILPEVDELEMLKSFDGDKSKLGNAEKFFLQLVQVPKYLKMILSKNPYLQFDSLLKNTIKISIFQLQTAYRVYAVEGRIRRQYELFGTEHQLYDPSWRRFDDEQTSSRGVVHGSGNWKLSQFGTSFRKTRSSIKRTKDE